MTSRRSRLWLGAVALAALLGATAVPSQENAAEQTAATEEVAPSLDIEEILSGEEDVFAGRGYGYDPAGRRDPFRSLVRARDSSPDRGPRPDGIPGLLIGEVDLTGVFVLPEGPVAQVQTSDRDRSYLLRVGDQLFDGDVVGVSLEEVVFRQVLDDPTALTPFREVVKRLNP